MADNPVDNSDGPAEAIPRVGVTDAQRELASNAHIEFESKHYDRCLLSLNKLSELRKSDKKVQHNRIVAQFYMVNCTGSDESAKNFMKIRKQIEKESGETGDDLDDIDMAHLLYNESVIYFHLRQYTKALPLLERLFKIVEPLEETLGYKICFLLIEIYLTLYKADKAHNVLTILENLVFGSSKQVESQVIQGGLQAQLGPGNQSAVQTVKDVDESLKISIHQYKARLNILLKSMKACKREIKTFMNTSNMTAESLFLKSNFEYQRQNFRKSIKLLNSAPKPSYIKDRGQSLSTMYYNNLGCIHFQLHKYNLAAFYFRRALQENDKALALLPPVDKNAPVSSRSLVTLGVNRRHEILYNLGIQLLFCGRPGVAFDCLVEAVQVYHTNPRLWLRLAECCIVSFQLSDDFRQKCIKKSDVIQDVVGSGPHRKIVLSPQTDKQYSSEESKGQSSAMPACTLAFASLCLQNALMLLKSAEVSTVHESESALLENQVAREDDSVNQEMDASSDNGGLSRSSNIQSEASIPAPPGPPVKLRELPHLRCSILACSAYVALGLGDNVMALAHAQRLLSQSNLLGALKFLGHLYAAEALIKLSRLPEAIMHLSTENVNNISIVPPCGAADSGVSSDSADKDSSKLHMCEKMYFPQSLSEARASFLVNLAGVYSLRSEFDKARKCLQQACAQGYSKEMSSRMVLLAVYIELQSGNVAGALQTIKKHQVLSMTKVLGKTIKKTRGADIWKT
ncbi:CCR4-NOT transcription complex subunit 10-like isoform X1 [Acropora millepora]|uniref:CCR4-NOT transcription complex subunit 10-like isoform X1 n=1 Tax=Acropora millepora TaxID=45264 RepID=UPI001CF179ED|nr:CCR4-NOT transcription complex subunit 10-like isoform X1 [Acropora millepora]